MASPPVPISANQGDARHPREPSSLYKLVMTPLIFVSFVLSLALVDLRHSALRAHYHADASQPSRLPRWLHRLVYRYQPYRYVAVDERGRPLAESPATTPGGSPASPGSPGSPGSAGSPGTPGLQHVHGEDYYHSKQRKLMRMEAAEAFEIRGFVLVGLGLLNLAVLWVCWMALRAAWAWVRRVA